MQGAYSGAQMRASDADRDLVLDELSTSFEAGRLTAEEFDERSSRALAAKTMGELGQLTADLPRAQPPPPPGQPAAPYPPGPYPPAGPLPARAGLARPPVVAAAAAIAIVAIVVGSIGHGTWHDAWVLVVVVVFMIRRGIGRHRDPDFFRRNQS
jgi:hypothetical protein